jgi:hypothetical protein
MKMHLLLSIGVEGCVKNYPSFFPLSRESFLKKQVNRIIFSIVFVFCHHQGFPGHVRVIFLKRDELKTQLAIHGPRQGHALKISRETCSDSTDLDYFQNEMKAEILQ